MRATRSKFGGKKLIFEYFVFKNIKKIYYVHELQFYIAYMNYNFYFKQVSGSRYLKSSKINIKIK